MKPFRVLGFASLLAATIASVAPPANAFTSGGWEGQANNDEDGTFRDCTMTADYANGITLAFIISRDFGWGLVLANDKWDLHVGGDEGVKLQIDDLAQIPGTLVKTESSHLIQIAHLNMGEATGDVANADSAFLHGAVLSSFK